MENEIYIVSMVDGLMKGYFVYGDKKCEFEAHSPNKKAISVEDIISTIQDFQDAGAFNEEKPSTDLLNAVENKHMWKNRLEGIDFNQFLTKNPLTEHLISDLQEPEPPLDYVEMMSLEEMMALEESYVELDYPEYSHLTKLAQKDPGQAVMELLDYLFDIGIFDDDIS